MLNANDDADPDAGAHAVLDLEAGHKTVLTLKVAGARSKTLLERCWWLKTVRSRRSRKCIAWTSAERCSQADDITSMTLSHDGRRGMNRAGQLRPEVGKRIELRWPTRR